ncbi:MAG: hypothetical protein HY326_01040 [Chloroflexi bacterium]|nr:hypothetical protein [Chloroflexota bacterium]
MSFVITLYVREGIVMASDSRMTLQATEPKGDQQIVHLAVGMSDYNYKTFLGPNHVGISTYGTADIGGVPIAGYMESFINENLAKRNHQVNEIPNKLLTYFRQLATQSDTHFHVAGYRDAEGKREQEVWHVSVAQNKVERLNPPGRQGASWGGEADILARLIQPVAVLDEQNQIRQVLPNYQIPWQFFTLQDAIDFAIFALRSTIDAIRFQPRAKTVGGPIDVLVIKPQEAVWVQRKELHG